MSDVIVLTPPEFRCQFLVLLDRRERLDCLIRFLSRVFIWEKLLSTEAVPTGIERQMFARVLMLGNIVISISLVVSSVNWEYRVPFGCLDT